MAKKENLWLKEDIEILKIHFNTATEEQLKILIPNKDLKSCVQKAYNLKLPIRDKRLNLDGHLYKYTSYIDNASFKTLGDLYSYHIKKYKISNEETAIILSGKPRPVCKCGCGEHTRLKPESIEFNDYAGNGHVSRVKK